MCCVFSISSCAPFIFSPIVFFFLLLYVLQVLAAFFKNSFLVPFLLFRCLFCFCHKSWLVPFLLLLLTLATPLWLFVVPFLYVVGYLVSIREGIRSQAEKLESRKERAREDRDRCLGMIAEAVDGHRQEFDVISRGLDLCGSTLCSLGRARA